MKKYISIWLTATFLIASQSAQADRMPLPGNAPDSFKAECSSCHMAFPPALLSTDDWRKTMGQLDKHFGTDASVDAKTTGEIGAFLERHAGSGQRVEGAGNPPRITKTARFERKHREIPKKFWRDPRVKSAANCEACHQGAEKGHFSEHDILIPELRD
jgi:nitrate/TMAO reductase-like tetraheme cytochrome c subunit